MEVRLKEKIPGVFWPVHQAIRRGEVTEVVAKGGRGSGKSSYLSMELVWQLLRHPDCHAVVLRKVGGTLRNSVYNPDRMGHRGAGVRGVFPLHGQPDGVHLSAHRAEDLILRDGRPGQAQKLKAAVRRCGHLLV